LGFGQLPIKLYFVDKLKAREHISSALDIDRVKILASVLPPATINTWTYDIFSSKLFSAWWTEWKKHLFFQASTFYYLLLDVDHIISDDEVRIFLISRFVISS